MKNFMLIYLNKVPTNSSGEPEHHVFQWDSKKIGCLHPNEPAIQFVQDRLSKKSETIDAIFYLANPSVIELLSTQKISHEKFFRALPICRGKKLYAIESQSEDGLAPILKMSQLIQNIGEQFQDDVRLHLDLTSGNSSILLAISQILECSGIEPGLTLYTNFETHRVENSSEVCRLFQLFSGVGEFINFCNVRSIEKYFSNRKTSPELRRLLDKIRQFDNSITICRTAEMEQLAAELREAMMDFAFVGNKTQQEKIFVNLLEIFEAEYRDILNENLSRLDIIHYCARKNFLQQAMTLCTEWLPVYFVQNNFCYPKNPETKNYVEPMHSRWEQTFIVNISSAVSRFVPKLEVKPQSRSKNLKPNEMAKKFKIAVSKMVESDEKLTAESIGINNSQVDATFAALSRADRILQWARESNEPLKEFLKKRDREVFKLAEHAFQKYNAPQGMTFDEFLDKKVSRKILARSLQMTSDALVIQMFNFNAPMEHEDLQLEKHSERSHLRTFFRARGVLSDFDYAIENVADVLKKYSAIREQRNLINHASEKTVLTNEQIRQMILDCISAIRDLEEIPENAFINHTPQSSKDWSAEKISAAEEYGVILDIPFPKIDPSWDEEKISALVQSNAKKISALNPSAVLCQGDDLSYVFAIVSEMKSRGILVLFAPGGINFAQFRSYETLPLA